MGISRKEIEGKGEKREKMKKGKQKKEIEGKEKKGKNCTLQKYYILKFKSKNHNIKVKGRYEANILLFKNVKTKH